MFNTYLAHSLTEPDNGTVNGWHDFKDCLDWVVFSFSLWLRVLCCLRVLTIMTFFEAKIEACFIDYELSQEVWSLPLGPQQTSPMFFAGGRLGVQTWTVYLWDKAQRCGKHGLYLTIFTRVVEKGVCLATELLRYVIGMLKERNILQKWMTLKLFSDCGPHFRANRFLGACATELADFGKCHFSINYGLEQHMKGLVDGKMGNDYGVINDYASTKWVTSIVVACQVLRDDYERRKALSSEIANEECHD